MQRERETKRRIA